VYFSTGAGKIWEKTAATYARHLQVTKENRIDMTRSIERFAWTLSRYKLVNNGQFGCCDMKSVKRG